MGREVRMVPAGWQHPRDESGRYVPMLARSYADEADAWVRDCILWAKGEHPSQKDGDNADCKYFWEYEGPPPRGPEKYMPDWAAAERTHYMMYEDTSEGTPISPAFATPEDLAHWLADTGASSFGGMTATYEQWLRVCRGGYAPSMVVQGGVARSGVAL